MNINNRTFKIFIFFIEKLIKERRQEKNCVRNDPKVGCFRPCWCVCHKRNWREVLWLAILRNERIITVKFCPSFLILYFDCLIQTQQSKEKRNRARSLRAH